MATKEQKEWQEYQDLCNSIRESTQPTLQENAKQQSKRIEKLLSSFEEFCYYYFDNFIDSKFGWFHKQAARKIGKNPNCIAVLEWAREHAKSVFAAVFMPMYLKAKGDFTGMVVASANQEKATVLLSDIQAQLANNQKYIADFGEQVSFGDWRNGYFTTRDGCGFWAFGRGQSPRGIRKAAKRPNYALVDDIDDKEICKNPKRVKEAVDWVWEDLYPALPTKGSRMIVAGNRIHKHSILAHIVGDLEVGDPIRKGLIHIKVFAVEDQYHRASYFGQKGARPAWKERYTMAVLQDKLEKMPSHSRQREYFHRHVEKGLVFKQEWIHYVKPRPKYDQIVFYGDPSFKDTNNADYKAIVGIGSHKGKIDVLEIWVRRTSISNMVKKYYDFHEQYGSSATYWIEANMLQEMFLQEFDAEAEERGHYLPIRGDKTKKPDKVTRIMNLEPIFQRAVIRFIKALQGSPDMEQFLIQLLGFPSGANDDAPDALEGAVIKINKQTSSSNFRPRMGSHKKSRR